MFPAEILGKYACYDGVATYQLWEKWKELTKNPVYPKIMDAIKELGYMELNGAPIDEKCLDATMIPLQNKIKELYGKLMQEVRKVRGEDAEINFNSPKQLAHLFFEEMGLTSIKQTDTGNPSTDKEVLNELANQGVIIAKLLLEYRTLNKFVNTYLTNIKENIDEDGRVRTSFNITGTTSGRLSSGKDANAGDFAIGKTLNFQNIPSTDKTVKKLFVPDKKDYVVLNMDLKNAELWLVGVLANEPNILNAFANGEDIHSSAAVKMFNLTCTPNDVKEKFPDLRQKAKTINFAILYLAGPGRIAQELQIDYGEAKNLISTWYKAFPKVAEWIRKNKMKIEQTGEATTYFGRYRYDPDVFSMNSAVAAHHVKSLVNMLIQSVASDINLFGYSSGIKEIREFDLRFEPFALVHDSIVGICHKDDVSLVVSILKRHIQNVLPCWVPIGVDVETGPSWGEVK
jgi:DNA polymerase-1